MFFTQEDYKKIEEYLKLNSEKDTDFENIGLNSIDKDDIITLIHENKNVKTRLYDLFLSEAYLSLLEEERLALLDKIQELELIILNLKINEIHISDKFGTDDYAAPSVSITTNALNRIWQKLEDMTGECLQGINMVVTPTYFVSDDGCTLHVTANTVEANGVFEKIQFFVNNELIYEASNTEYVSFDYHLDNKPIYDYVVMCKAKIMGIEYTRQQLVTKYNEFYIGAGSVYSDVMNSAHAKQLNGTMRHNYDITFGESDKLVIVMGEGLRPGFIRADLNGVEIELTEETVTVDGKQYAVFTSEAWSAGDYNIDING